MYFWCLVNSNYRRTWKLSLHHDFFHYNVHTWWNFQIFWNKFLFHVIFSSLSLQKFSEKSFFLKKISNFVKWRRHLISSLKNKYNFFHTYLSKKWQQTQWWATRLEISGYRSVLLGLTYLKLGAIPLFVFHRVFDMIFFKEK